MNERFSQEVGSQESRRVKSRREGVRSVYFGFGMFGLVGWSVAVPTLLGVMLGRYLDDTRPQSFSWTLSLLVVGLFVGSLNAWHWVVKEDRAMHVV